MSLLKLTWTKFLFEITLQVSYKVKFGLKLEIKYNRTLK